MGQLQSLPTTCKQKLRCSLEHVKSLCELLQARKNEVRRPRLTYFVISKTPQSSSTYIAVSALIDLIHVDRPVAQLRHPNDLSISLYVPISHSPSSDLDLDQPMMLKRVAAFEMPVTAAAPTSGRWLVAFAIALLAPLVVAQFDWYSYAQSVTAQPPVSGPEGMRLNLALCIRPQRHPKPRLLSNTRHPPVDWFLDNDPNALPLHPFRMRSRLQVNHPKSCPVGTVRFEPGAQSA